MLSRSDSSSRRVVDASIEASVGTAMPFAAHFLASASRTLASIAHTSGFRNRLTMS
jgi:hypothetical protein